MRKILSFFLLFTLLFTGISQSYAFDDIIDSSPSGKAINFLIDEGIIKDDFNFYPNRPIQLDQYITWTIKNQGYYLTGNKHRYYYHDVPHASEYAPYISKAVDLGLLDPNKDFLGAKSPVTKLEALEYLFILEGIPTPLVPTDDLKFKDLKTNREKAIIDKAISLSIAEPVSEEYFGAHAPITKAESAKYLYNIALMSTSQWGNGISDADFVFEVTATSEEVSIMQEAWDTIVSDYYKPDEINKEELLYSTLEGMVEGLKDDHSVFQRPQQSNAFTEELSGEFEGIGAYIQKNSEGKFEITAPMPESPAEKAGVRAGDIIIAVNGDESKDLTIYELINKIKGPEGTSVSITFLRGNKTLELDIIREKIEIQVVNLEMNGKTAIIKIAEFTDTVGEKFYEAAEEALNKGATSIIIDVRNNPGGYLDSAGDILSSFIESGKDIFYIEFGDNQKITYRSNGEAELQDLNIVILQNAGSASAAEVITLVLREQLGAKVIGEESYGKGSAQRLYPFFDGSTLKLSVAKWVTPDGQHLEKGVGIIPDIEAVDDPETSIDEALNIALRHAY